MSIQFRCAGCSQPIEVDKQFAGKTAQCPYCQKIVTVPVESTLESSPPAIARPAGGAALSPTLPPTPPPIPGSYRESSVGEPVPYSRLQPPDPREAAARSFGNFALIFLGLAIALMVAQMIFTIGPMTSELSRQGTSNPSSEQMQVIARKIATERPYLVAFGFGSLFFGLVALILGIVSWRQWPAANWRAWVTIGVGSLFVLCICGSFALASVSGLGG